MNDTHKETRMIEYYWSEKYQTTVMRVGKIQCENENCEKLTTALYNIGCVNLCLKCFREWRVSNENK